MTRQIRVGGVPIGGGAPVTIQSMTNTRTDDVEATLRQIRELAAAGKIVTLVYFFFALPGALFQNGKRFIQTCRIDADHNRDAAPFQKSSAGMKQRYKKACLV